MVKFQQFATRWSSSSQQGSWFSNCHHRCDKPVCTYDTLWRQHYITTSKEHL